MHRSVIPIFGVKTKKFQLSFPGPLTRVKEYGWHVEFALELTFYSPNAQVWMKRFQVRHQEYGVVTPL
jgi:hypothetical protein